MFNAFSLGRLGNSRPVFGAFAAFAAGRLVGPITGSLNTILLVFFAPDTPFFSDGASYARPCILPRMATPLTQRMGLSWLQSSPDFRHFPHGTRDWSHRTCRFRHGQQSLDSFSSIFWFDVKSVDWRWLAVAADVSGPPRLTLVGGEPFEFRDGFGCTGGRILSHQRRYSINSSTPSAPPPRPAWKTLVSTVEFFPWRLYHVYRHHEISATRKREGD